MSSTVAIEMETPDKPLQDNLIELCKKFDDESEKLRLYYHYKSFCESLLKYFPRENEEDHPEPPSRISYPYPEDKNERIMNEVIQTALKVQNKEYKIKILKVLVIYWNKREIKNMEKYESIKSEIFSLFPPLKSDSIFNMSEDYITSECDRAYFELCFLLKQNQLKKFEFDFETLVERFKRFCGDYWKYSMKKDCGRFLKEIAENRRYYKTIEFMLHKCPFIELDSTIVTEFEELKYLMFVYGDEIVEKDKTFINQWKEGFQNFEAPDDESDEKDFRERFEKHFPDDEVTRKRLFGRTSEADTSLLEEMLLCSSSSFIFECAWNRFRLWTLPEIFRYKNPSGKALIDYVIESGNNEQIRSFLMPKTLKNYSENNFDKPKHFLVMKNNQLYSRTEKCIVEHLMENLVDDQNDVDSNDEDEIEEDGDGSLFPHFSYLLEEIGVRKELEKDALVEKLIYFSKCDNLFQQVTGKFLDNKNEKANKLFHIEDILGNMMVYWRGESEHYLEYKRELEQVSPFYKLMFLLIEKDKKFCDDFKENMTKLEESFTTRYNKPKRSESYSSNMLFIMLLAAIKTKQRNLIDFIFQNDNFQTIDFKLPDNIVAEEIHYYTALKFLKYKHGIGQSRIPFEWLTLEVLEHFFDSEIKFNNQELIEIDYTSLLHPESQKNRVKQETDKRGIVMRDDVVSLEYIIDQENLNELITHPLIETYINLKSLKYQRIFTWNFWAFVIFFITPFVMLILYNAFPQNIELLQTTRVCWYSDISMLNYTKEPENFDFCIPDFLIRSFLGIMKYSHIIAIIFLFSRETFQFILSESHKKYFQKSSNLFEMTLFTLSILLSVATIRDKREYIKHLEVVFILFTTISATSILPFAHVPINMQILRKVAVTFLRIFYTFAIIFIAFSFAFCIMFMKDHYEKCDGNDCEVTDNFYYPHTALVKIVTMLSGEYEIQPAQLETSQLLFFSIFIITSFILFNLILGLSIEDVQDLKKKSRAFDLTTKSERFIEVSKKVEEFYADHEEEYRESQKDKTGKTKVKFWVRLSFRIIIFFLSKYPGLHNITQVMINIKTKEVFTKAGMKPILKSNNGTRYDKYLINEETFKDIQDIITNKNKKTFKHLKKKLEEENA